MDGSKSGNDVVFCSAYVSLSGVGAVVVGGDKFGNLFVLRVPDDVDDIDFTSLSGPQTLWNTDKGRKVNRSDGFRPIWHGRNSTIDVVLIRSGFFCDLAIWPLLRSGDLASFAIWRSGFFCDLAIWDSNRSGGGKSYILLRLVNSHFFQFLEGTNLRWYLYASPLRPFLMKLCRITTIFLIDFDFRT